MAAEGTLADGTSRLSLDGTTLHHFNSISSFAGHAVVPESAAVKIRTDVALHAAALVGCSVLTGYGAVANTAGLEEGATVAVWGCGGVGANVVQGARLRGAAQIVAVDTRPEKFELARTLGATDVVEAGAGVDAVAAVQDLTGGGPDYAFEAIGSERAIQEAWKAVRAGGTLVVVGIMPRGASLTIDPWQFMSEKTLKGTFLGSARIQEDVPHLIDLYQSGDLELDRLVSRTLRLDELPDAFDRLRAGEVVRQVVVFD
jgi:Zn-dependent alcohol dehydrogenase